MMVKNVTNFHKPIWEVWVCLNVCVQGFIQDFEFWEEGGELQSLVVMRRGSGGMLLQIFFIIFFIDDLRLILRHSGGTSSSKWKEKSTQPD